MSLSESVLEGNRLALARLLTEVENGSDVGIQATNELYTLTGRAHLIGVTGASGTGKSSLVNQLALQLRNSSIQDNEQRKPPRIAIVAVDPSSPFTGGAILGDRIRMRDLAGDEGIFIRSMASRGSLGGLAKATAGIVQILDAAGFDIILIETVGAGQTEVDIASLAHTTIVVVAPNLGDDIQAIKAGILEIADLLVINKADLPGVESAERALRGMVHLAHSSPREFINHHGLQLVYESQRSIDRKSEKNPSEEALIPEWNLDIYKTIALDGTGIDVLIGGIYKHLDYLRDSGEWYKRDNARVRSEFDMLLKDHLVKQWRETIDDEDYRQILEKVYDREVSPWEAVNLLTEAAAS